MPHGYARTINEKKKKKEEGIETGQNALAGDKSIAGVTAEVVVAAAAVADVTMHPAVMCVAGKQT